MTEEQQINNLINVQDFLQKIEAIAAERRIEYLDAVSYTHLTLPTKA